MSECSEVWVPFSTRNLLQVGIPGGNQGFFISLREKSGAQDEREECAPQGRPESSHIRERLSLVSSASLSSPQKPVPPETMLRFKVARIS